MIALIAALFVGTFVFLYQKSRPKQLVYEISTVELKDLEKSTIVTGKIEPRDEVNIKPQISGIIAELYKEAGQMVRKDEVIAKVKVIPDMSSLNSAENRVRLAEINLAQAQTDFQRMEKLYQERVVSAEDYEKSQVALKQAQTEMTNSRDGPVILSNSFNDGTTIATVADMSNLIFRGNIDETEVGRIVEGMPVTITVGAVQNLRMPARLEYISPKGRETNGANQFEIKAALVVPDTVTLRSGYGANAEIVLERATKAICVPEAALEFSGDSTFVYVLTDSVPQQKFLRRRVETGLSNGVDIEVKSGVRVGEKVRGILKDEKN